MGSSGDTEKRLFYSLACQAVIKTVLCVADNTFVDLEMPVESLQYASLCLTEVQSCSHFGVVEYEPKFSFASVDKI